MPFMNMGLVIGGACFLGLILILWRLWPLIRGRAKDGESLVNRLYKWNTYVLPIFRKHLQGKMLVVHGRVFRSKLDQKFHSMATWNLEQASVLPKVEYIIIALPRSSEDDMPEIFGIVEASVLREKLPSVIQTQTFWGHTMWLCVFGPEADISVLTADAISKERFRERHGMPEGETV